MNKKASEKIIKLSQNENPVGASPLALKAVKEHSLSINRYPEPHSITLKKELADSFAISSENIFVCAGSIEALDILIRNFIGENENIIIPKVTFVAYKILANVFGVTANFSGMKDYRIDIDSILENYNNHTKMIIISSPNNPTGTIVSEKEMIKLLENVSPQTFVVVDEAYCEYVSDSDYPNTLELQKKYPNLIILRTFSKIYGLAGLRVGYAIAAQDIIEQFEYYQPPFTVNQMATVAASASIKDKKFLKDSFEANIKTRTLLEKELTGLGYNVIPSQGNFIFMHFGRIEERDLIFERLTNQNVLTRKMDFFGDSKALRITVPKPNNCQYVINCLAK